MIITPKVRGFICTTTHPTGCDVNVQKQIEYVKSHGPIANGPKKVLVIGSSTGYGLASRISAAFGSGAATIGVFFEKPGTEKKPGTAGWYNAAAFQKFARAEGLYAKSINGLAKSGIVSLPQDIKFNPNTPITYNEALTMVIRAAGYGVMAQTNG